MHILVTGASGMIGRAVLRRLLAAGHTVRATCRRPPAQAQDGVEWLAADMGELRHPDDWQALLDDVDVVINTVGIFRDGPGQSMDVVHHLAPGALFEACMGLPDCRVIHVSAVGATVDAPTAYWRTKALGDAALMRSTLDWVIVQPSLVYARDGISSLVFLRMAASTPMFYPADAGDVQPIHLDDLADLLVKLVEAREVTRRIIPAVGPRALPFRDYLLTLRGGMGIHSTTPVPVPALLTAFAASIAAYLPDSLLRPDSLTMLRRGNTADSAAVGTLLGRPLRDPTTFAAAGLRAGAAVAAWRPLARLALAVVWLWTAWVTLAMPAAGLALLAETRLPQSWHWPTLLVGGTVDALFGVLTLVRPRRTLWLAQITLILTYTAIITITAPHWWLHPFGPVSKNLPILALLFLLYQIEER